MENRTKKRKTSKRAPRKSAEPVAPTPTLQVPNSPEPEGSNFLLILILILGLGFVVGGPLIWLGAFKKHSYAAPTPQKLDITINGIRAISGNTGWVAHPIPFLNHNIVGGPLKIGKVTYPHGIGTHAPSTIVFNLAGQVKKFSCMAGADIGGSGGNDSIYFMVRGDGKKLYRSPKLTVQSPPVSIHLNVTGIKQLSLIENPTGDYHWCWGDWVNLQFTR
jgi:hypothetical protein